MTGRPELRVAAGLDGGGAPALLQQLRSATAGPPGPLRSSATPRCGMRGLEKDLPLGADGSVRSGPGRQPAFPLVRQDQAGVVRGSR